MATANALAPRSGAAGRDGGPLRGMRVATGLLAAAAVLQLVGCAHPINVEPDMARVGAGSSRPLPMRVGYHLPDALANQEVTTPGGGGDNVRYNPYAAMSTGYQRMLSQVFQGVTRVPAPAVDPKAGDAAPDYVLTPLLTTNSGGSNFFTWPPENFSVDLTTSIRDRSGKVVATPRVVGTGTATTGERLGDHGFSGRRAFEDALRKMEAALREWGGSRGPQAAAGQGDAASRTAERLQALKDLLDRRQISEAEYDSKRRAILAEL